MEQGEGPDGLGMEHLFFVAFSVFFSNSRRECRFKLIFMRPSEGARSFVSPRVSLDSWPRQDFSRPKGKKRWKQAPPVRNHVTPKPSRRHEGFIAGVEPYWLVERKRTPSGQAGFGRRRSIAFASGQVINMFQSGVPAPPSRSVSRKHEHSVEESRRSCQPLPWQQLLHYSIRSVQGVAEKEGKKANKRFIGWDITDSTTAS